MSTTTHTPGPWELRPTSRAGNGTGWRDIVSTRAAFGPTYVAEALEQDAALIAAAPELLAALRMALVQIKQDNCERGIDTGLTESQVRAAIAKAEGLA